MPPDEILHTLRKLSPEAIINSYQPSYQMSVQHFHLNSKFLQTTNYFEGVLNQCHVDPRVVDITRQLKAGQRTNELPTYELNERVKHVTSTRIAYFNGDRLHKQTISFDLNGLTTVDEKRETGNMTRTIKGILQSVRDS